jgi:hypothetical protein
MEEESMPSLSLNRKSGIAVIALVSVASAILLICGPSYWHAMLQKIKGERTIEDAVSDIGSAARDRLRRHFESVGVAYPPSAVTLLAIKDVGQLELWAGPDDGPTWIHTYPIQALSGTKGAKLREGDLEVPEGIYEIEGLNPNSRYHLSLKLNYPNAFDLKHAQDEGRREPGSDIFLHGKAVSVGCLAMGDEAIEELFLLTHDIGVANVKVIISPSDPRTHALDPPPTPAWTAELYKEIEAEFRKYAPRKNLWSHATPKAGSAYFVRGSSVRNQVNTPSMGWP